MNEEAMRKAFEDCITEGGKWPKAVERMPDGTYKLIQTHAAWRNYQHGWQAATRAAVPAWQPIKDAPTTGRDLLVITGPNMFPQIARSNTWFAGGFPAEYKPTLYIPLPPTPAAEP